jgi:hypothetical protein
MYQNINPIMLINPRSVEEISSSDTFPVPGPPMTFITIKECISVEEPFQIVVDLGHSDIVIYYSKKQSVSLGYGGKDISQFLAQLMEEKTGQTFSNGRSFSQYLLILCRPDTANVKRKSVLCILRCKPNIERLRIHKCIGEHQRVDK